MAYKKLMIIDANSIANRAFYGIRMLTTKTGQFTNSIYGFLNILLKYTEEYSPDYICAAFDMAAPTFRHNMFDDYKAGRKQMPDELAAQFPVLKQVLKAFGIMILEKEGYEADDIIGTIADICESSKISCMIVTGDKDDLQLATDKTQIYLTTTGKGLTQTRIFDADAVKESYGVSPKEFIDVKALMGDPSDNIPGVSGIGEKGALKLISEYKSIENIYKAIDNGDDGIKGAIKNKLIDGRDMAFLSKKLAVIDKNVPIEFSFDDFSKLRRDDKKLFELLSQLEFNSILKKLDLSLDIEEIGLKTIDLEKLEIEHICDYNGILKCADRVKELKEMTYILYQKSGQICGLGVKLKNYTALATVSFTLTQDMIIDAFAPVFSDKNIKITGHNTKEDIVLLNEFGACMAQPCFDTAIGAYILSPSLPDYKLSVLGSQMLGVSIPDEEEVLGKGKKCISISDVDTDKALEFAAAQLSIIDLLKEYIEKQLKENNQTKLYYEIELPLIMTLARMQISGFYVDKKQLEEFSNKINIQLDQLTEGIYRLAGCEFNINSTKQLGEVLFEKLGLRVIKKTKTGYSTDATVLEALKGSHEIIDLLLEYRQAAKIKSTYIDGLIPQIKETTGRIHSSFNQTVTATGRISSTEPNLQNIPIRHSLGREIRRMFTASEDFILIDADYSQIELRVLAHIAGDSAMKQAFLDGVDIHTSTAAKVFGISIDEVKESQRSFAKAVNFGIVYGIGEYSLSQDLKISVSEAKNYIESYLSKYSGVKNYMSKIKNSANEKGFVETLLNRRRYIPEILSSNYNLRSFGERVALNTPIQGTAADIIKFAMVRVDKALRDKNFKSRLILQVHDELIVEAHKDEFSEVYNILKYEMENAIKLDVPLVVDIKTAKSWYDTK